MQSLAVVTGGSGDIGAAIAIALSPHYRVLVLDRVAPEVQRQQLFDAHQIDFVKADVSELSEVEYAFRVAQEFGELRVLCCAAGGSHYDHLGDMSYDAWKEEIRSNLDSAFLCAKACLPTMRATQEDCAIINIASVNGLATFGHPGYSVAKAGMIHLTRFIAIEYGKHNIRANTIAPGTVMTNAWKAREASNPALKSDLLKVYPANDLPTPDKIAQLAYFLTTPAASAINGTCIPVDAGLTAGSVPMNQLFTQSDFDGLQIPSFDH